MGKNCKYEGMKIRDYSYHPDFTNNIFSAFAMVQLEDDDLAGENFISSNSFQRLLLNYLLVKHLLMAFTNRLSLFTDFTQLFTG